MSGTSGVTSRHDARPEPAGRNRVRQEAQVEPTRFGRGSLTR